MNAQMLQEDCFFFSTLISCAEKHCELKLMVSLSLSGRQVCSYFLVNFCSIQLLFSDKRYQFRGVHRCGLMLFLKYCTYWLGWMTRTLNCTESNFQQLIPCVVLWGYGVILCPFWLESSCPLSLACESLLRWVQALVVSQPAWKAPLALSAAKQLPHHAGAS